MGVIAGLVAFGLAYMARPRGARRVIQRPLNVLETRNATFELHQVPPTSPCAAATGD